MKQILSKAAVAYIVRCGPQGADWFPHFCVLLAGLQGGLRLTNVQSWIWSHLLSVDCYTTARGNQKYSVTLLIINSKGRSGNFGKRQVFTGSIKPGEVSAVDQPSLVQKKTVEHRLNQNQTFLNKTSPRRLLQVTRVSREHFFNLFQSQHNTTPLHLFGFFLS